MAGDAGWRLGKVRSRDPAGKRLKEAEGQFVLADKLLSVSPGTQGRKSASNSRERKKKKKRNFPGISKGLPTLGMRALRLRQPHP